MKTHEEIDQRSLALAHAVAAEIDRDPERQGLQKARKICARRDIYRRFSAEGGSASGMNP